MSKEKKSAGKNEFDALFSTYETVEKEYDALKAQLDTMAQRKSDAVKAIADKAKELGLDKRPLSRNGRVLSVSRRDTKEKNAEGVEVVVASTYFFRGPREAAVEC